MVWTVNNELNKIKVWLRNNKISLNIFKINYILIDNYINISIRSLRSFDNLLFKFNVSLPLVTGRLLQNTVDVNKVTYKLYNIKI